MLHEFHVYKLSKLSSQQKGTMTLEVWAPAELKHATTASWLLLLLLLLCCRC